ncbi:hypothetical protein JZ785_01895 [Alicyclobacillus curvatus]|nr:hypothetical protein JZ785_01895 [Alicyclobacillus curvatus]
MGWNEESRSRFQHHMDGGQHGHRRIRGWSVILALLVMLAAAGLVYYIFFRIYNIGPRTMVVNGEAVEQIDGFSVHSKTWLSRTQVERFLSRVQANSISLPAVTKTYQGHVFVRADDLVRGLNHLGDRSTLAGTELQITLTPTQHYSYQQSGDTIRQQEVFLNGKLAGHVLTVVHDEATYALMSDFSTALEQAGVQNTWNGKILSLAPRAANASNSPLAPVSDAAQDGKIVFGDGKAIYAPKYVFANATYLPVLSISAALRQSGWAATIGTWQWTLDSHSTPGRSNSGGLSSSNMSVVPAQTPSQKPVSLAFVPFYVGDLAAFHDAMSHPQAYNALAGDTWSVDASGSLVGSAPSGTASQAVSAGYAAYAMVTNLGNKGFDAKTMHAILSNPTLSSHLEEQIAKGVESEGYDGAMLDFELIRPQDAGMYTEFVAKLAADLHAEDKRLEVVIPADTGPKNEPWNAGYDVSKLGASADDVVVMAYDYSYAGGPAGPIAPLPWVQQTLAYTVSRVPANKVLLGIDTYGYDWSGKAAKAVSLTSVDSFLASRHMTANWDSAAQAPWFKWTDSKGHLHTVYYENAQSTSAKLALAKMYGISGVAVWRAGMENNAVLKTLASYVK